MRQLLTIVECPKCNNMRLAVYDDGHCECEHVTCFPRIASGWCSRDAIERVPCTFKAELVTRVANPDGSLTVTLKYKVLRPYVPHLPELDHIYGPQRDVPRPLPVGS